MQDSMIVPDQLPMWVPGDLTVCSPEQGWDGLSIRGYRYTSLDVEVPPLRDYMIVALRRGAPSVRRRVGDAWVHEQLQPGDVSVLTRAAESHWIWSSAVEVVHVYLTQDELAQTCRQMYEHDVHDVELRDELKADDPAIHRTAMQLANEATQGAQGSKLLIDSLSTQLCVHILRRHAQVLFREPGGNDGLTLAQERAVRDYVHEHLHKTISLRDLADTVTLSRFHFARRFRASTGTSPHEFVLQQRVQRAKTMLTRTSTPLADVAQRCGFADQSHLTNVFKKRVGTTPGKFRSHP